MKSEWWTYKMRYLTEGGSTTLQWTLILAQASSAIKPSHSSPVRAPGHAICRASLNHKVPYWQRSMLESSTCLQTMHCMLTLAWYSSCMPLYMRTIKSGIAGTCLICWSKLEMLLLAGCLNLERRKA